MHWINVEDELPQFISGEGACVLLVWIPKLEIPTVLAYYNEQLGFRCQGQGGVVTHFMYIREPK
jgi:hypothetical protein